MFAPKTNEQTGETKTLLKGINRKEEGKLGTVWKWVFCIQYSMISSVTETKGTETEAREMRN